MNSPTSIPPDAATEWTATKRLVFRFSFAFFLIAAFFEFQFPIAMLQRLSFAPVRWFEIGGEAIGAFWERAFEITGYATLPGHWDDLVAWIGAHLCGPDAAVRPHRTGSGDTLRNWLGMFTAGSIAIVLTIVWSVLARRARDHRALASWLWVFARIFLASVMFGYGFAKVIPTQFQPPHLGRLLQPLGDFSPMGLLWTFMGSSPAYTIFAGAGELLGGLLLCFRRSATLGALVTGAVMTNVVAMNLCYDVPVKLYASFYLVIAMAIALPDVSRLLNVLLWNRPAPARDLSRPFGSRALNALATFLTLVWIADSSYTGVTFGLQYYRQSTASWIGSPFSGVYEIDSFERDGVGIPPLSTDETRWRRLVVERETFAVTRSMTEVARAFELRVDSEARTITLIPTPPRDAAGVALEGPMQHFTFAYEEVEPGRFRFTGEFEGSNLVWVAKRKTRDDFQLTNRGFRWISEDPFNR